MARPCMSGQLYMTQVTEATSKTICPKKHFAPHLKNPKDIATKKVNKPMYGTKLYHRVNFHADQHEISVLWQKIHIFLIGDCTGRLPSMLYIFGKLSSSQCYAPFDMRRYTFLESCRRANVTPHLTCDFFRYIRGQNLRFWSKLGVSTRGSDVSEIDIHHHAKFHADWCRRRRDICNRTDTDTDNYSRSE